MKNMGFEGIDQSQYKDLVKDGAQDISGFLGSGEKNKVLMANTLAQLKLLGLKLVGAAAKAAVGPLLPHEVGTQQYLQDSAKKDAADAAVLAFEAITDVPTPEYSYDRQRWIDQAEADAKMEKLDRQSKKFFWVLSFAAVLVIALLVALPHIVPQAAVGVDQEKLLAGINANLDSKFDAAKTERKTFEDGINTKLDGQNTRIGNIDAKIRTPEKLEAKIKEVVAADRQEQDKARTDETKKFFENGGKLNKLSNQKTQAALTSMLGQIKENEQDNAALEAFADQCLQEVDKLRAERLKSSKPFTLYIDGKPVQ